MLPLWATFIMSFLMLLFAVAGLSFSMALILLCAGRIVRAFRYWRDMPAAILTGVIIGGFAWMFGWGAYELGSAIIDGLIGRITGDF